tara:strand:+ start:465 stop:1388 length:924 start_codon:yes stop_codon:yes gene_type:complete
MNSFIFNFKKFLIIITMIVVIEIFLRNFSNFLSKDIVHYNTFKHTIDVIESNYSDNYLFLGNSLTRAALNKNLIKNFFDSGAAVGFIYPDDSNIALWYYILKLKFDSLNFLPKNIIIIFAKTQLQSEKINSKVLRQLAEICSLKDIKFIIKNEDLNFSNSMKLLIYKFSYSARYGQRISKRILVNLPYYKKTIRRLNNLSNKENNLNSNVQMSNYHHLDSLIELASKHNSNLTFISVYCGGTYNINKKDLDSIFEKKNIKLLDLRDDTNFNKNDLSDGYHLNQIGANKFSNIFLQYYKKSEWNKGKH